jgi:transposase
LYLAELAQAAGIEIQRGNSWRGWTEAEKEEIQPGMDEPSDPHVTKMKDGRTHLAHKAEHAVDVTTGALLAMTLQPADQGDTTTIHQTLEAAQAATQEVNDQGVEGLVADKGYHSGTVLTELHGQKVRSYIWSLIAGGETGKRRVRRQSRSEVRGSAVPARRVQSAIAETAERTDREDLRTPV